MKPLILKGCGTALFTPFRDGKVDEAAMAATVRRQVEAGIHFLVPLGTTGETPCLSVAERQRVLEITRENAPGKTLLVGGGTNSLTATLESMAQLPGADAYLIVVPYYNKPNQTGLYEYYKAKQEEEKEKNAQEKKEMAWGSQIRSYVFQPYTMVKDHRTKAEVGNIQSVMDGNIDYFIEEYLKLLWQNKENS